MFLEAIFAASAVLGGGFLVKKSFDVKATIAGLSYSIEIKSVKISHGNLVLSIKYNLLNPGQTSIEIKKPLIKLMYGNVELSKSYIDAIKINPQATSSFELTFKINIIANTSVFIGILKDLAINLSLKDLLSSAAVIQKNIDKIYKQFSVLFVGYVNGLAVTYNYPLSDESVAGLGYAPLSATNRRIVSNWKLDKFFPQPKKGKKINKKHIKNGGVKDTVFAMIDIVNSYSHEVAKAIHLVKGDSDYDTARRVFDFLFKHIKYNTERGEILNTPAVSYYWGQIISRKNQDKSWKTPIDCDDFSIFAASFLNELGIDWAFRIASYNGADFGHVYCVIPAINGEKEIIIDPVYWKFNAEKTYQKQETYNRNKKLIKG